MEVEIKKDGEKLFVTPKENIDSKTAPDFSKKVMDCIDSSIKSLTIEMKDVQYISSAGVRALLTFRKQLNGEKITLLNVSNAVKEVLNLSALFDYFDVK